MAIEYRTTHGERIEINANGRILPGTGQVNLRAMGCPEWLANKVENSRILKRAAQAMAIGAPEPAAPVSEEYKRRRAAEIGQQIADDSKRLREQEELRKRARASQGIIHG